MMGTTRRLCMSQAVAVILLSLLLIQGGAQGQGESYRGWDEIGEDEFQFDPDISEVATFAIQVSGEVRYRFHVALELMRAGNFRQAAEPLQEIINLFPNHLYQVAERPPRWVGAAEYAKYLLSFYPPEGRQEYSEWAALRVNDPFEKAREESDEAVLQHLADRWIATPAGLEALRILGDRAQERGDFELAARFYMRRLLFEDPPSERTAEIAFRAAAALTFQGEREAGARLLEPFQQGTARLAGETVDVGEGFRQLQAHTPATRSSWPVFGGAAHHGALVNDAVDGEFSFSEPWDVPAFSLAGRRNPYASGFPRGRVDFPFHPVVADGSIVLNDGLSVRCFSFFSDEPRWVRRGPLLSIERRSGGDVFYQFEDYADNQDGPIGSLARSLPLGATLHDGLVLAPLFDLRRRGKAIRFDSTEITKPIPTRSLHALDLESGETVWTQHQPELDEHAFRNRLSVSAPPVVVGDRVIASGYILEGAINFYVACFAVDDGRLLWKTPIVVGQQELTMFNKTFKEFTVQMPAEADGSVYVCTNLGLLASIDTLTGNLRWVTQYEAIPIQGSRHYSRAKERVTSSGNDAPIVQDGVVVFSPLDSYHFYGVDAATGKVLWARQHGEGRRGHRYHDLLGVQDGLVVLGGESGLGFFDLHIGRTVEEYRFSEAGGSRSRAHTAWGRGCLGAGTIYQPMQDHLLVLRWKIASFGLEFEEEMISWKPHQAGNLLLYDDFQITVSPERMTVFFDVDALVAQARSRVEGAEPSLEDLILLGDLENLRGQHMASITVYELAFEHPDVGREDRRRIHDGLHRSHRVLARLAEEAGDREGRLRHLREEARHATDPQDFLATAERLLLLHDQEQDFNAYIATLDWIDERFPEVDFPFAQHRFGGAVRAGLFTLERRSMVAMARGRPADAVAAWQQMIERYPDLPFERRTAGLYAQDRIGQAIETYGEKVYARFEQTAHQLHEAALAARDPVALGGLIDRFPNSSNAVIHRLDLARLLLDRGDHGAVFEVVAPLLSGMGDPEHRAHALYIGALGAESAGDEVLAAALWERLREQGADQAVLGGEGESYASVADHELARIDLEPDGGAFSRELHRLPIHQARQFALDFSADTRMVPVVGSDSRPIGGSVILYEPGLKSKGAAAWLRLIDVARTEERWRAEVDHYFSDSDPITAYLINDRLVVRQRKTLRGYDPETGALLFERQLPTIPDLVRPGPFMLFLQWNRPDGLSDVVAIELASGSVFWRRELSSAADDLVVADDLLLILAPDGVLEAVDGLTGSTRYSLSLLEISRDTTIKALSEFQLLLALGVGPGSRKATLLAFDLTDGRRLWSQTRLAARARARWIESNGESLVLLGASSSYGLGNASGVHSFQVLEPRSGKLLKEVSGLGQLSVFDRGSFLSGDHVVLVAGARNRRRRRMGEKHLVLVDIRDESRRRVSLAALPHDQTHFTTFSTSRGDLFGTVDMRPTIIPKGNATYVFTVNVENGELELSKVPSQHDNYLATGTTAADSMVVFKDDRLYIYPTEGDSR